MQWVSRARIRIVLMLFLFPPKMNPKSRLYFTFSISFGFTFLALSISSNYGLWVEMQPFFAIVICIVQDKVSSHQFSLILWPLEMHCTQMLCDSIPVRALWFTFYLSRLTVHGVQVQMLLFMFMIYPLWEFAHFWLLCTFTDCSFMFTN